MFPLEAASGSSPRWELFDRRPLQSLLEAASANRMLRAADAAIGVALVTLGSRGELPASATFVGIHAVRLGIAREMPGTLRRYAIEPHIERGGFSVSIQKKY